jgi:hypothetical protein
MGDAVAAFHRLLDALKLLMADLLAEPAAREHRSFTKLTGAQTVLVRHADVVIDTFGFIDGHRVDTPEPGLLTAFYAASSDASASRYCWALLHFQAPFELSQIVAAAQIEHDEFAKRHSKDADGQLAEHAERADRLSYRLGVLQRTMLAQRGQQLENEALSVEYASVANAVEEADAALHAMRVSALAKRRQGQRKLGDDNPGSGDEES